MPGPKKQIRGVMRKQRGPFVATVKLDPSQVVFRRRRPGGAGRGKRAI